MAHSHQLLGEATWWIATGGVWCTNRQVRLSHRHTETSCDWCRSYLLALTSSRKTSVSVCKSPVPVPLIGSAALQLQSHDWSKTVACDRSNYLWLLVTGFLATNLVAWPLRIVGVNAPLVFVIYTHLSQTFALVSWHQFACRILCLALVPLRVDVYTFVK